MNHHQPRGFFARCVDALAGLLASKPTARAEKPSDGAGKDYVIIVPPEPKPDLAQTPPAQEADELSGAAEFTPPEADPYGEVTDDDLPVVADEQGHEPLPRLVLPPSIRCDPEECTCEPAEPVACPTVADAPEPAIEAGAPGTDIDAAGDAAESSNGETPPIPSPAELAGDTLENSGLIDQVTGEDAAEISTAASDEPGPEAPAAADVPAIVTALTTTAKGKPSVPKEFYKVMRARYGHTREVTRFMLSSQDLGVAKRGDGKQILCAWVETLLRAAPDRDLTLSEIRTSLPELIRSAYSKNVSQGLAGAVSRCEYLEIVRDGKVVSETRAKAADIIRLA